MVSVLTLTARLKVKFPTVTTPGAWPQPVVFVALQVVVLITATLLKTLILPNGTYRLRVAGLTTGELGAVPTLMSGGGWAQPVVFVALQVAVLITATVLERGLEAYSVWVASSMLPTPMLASKFFMGIVATGAQPERSLVLQVAP